MTSTPRTADPGLAGALRGAGPALALGARQTLAGWPVLIGRCLFYVLILLVLTALWDKVAADRIPGALSLPAGGLALYIGAKEWVTLALPAVHLRLEDDIRSGGVEPQIGRAHV